LLKIFERSKNFVIVRFVGFKITYHSWFCGEKCICKARGKKGVFRKKDSSQSALQKRLPLTCSLIFSGSQTE
jgi:hypothetical protein